MRRVLVTGGAGYIGSHVALALLEAGWTVDILDDLSTGSRRLVPAGAQLHVGNTGDRAFTAALMAERRPEAVIHFAASISVPESVANPLKYYINNFVNSARLVETCVEAGVDKFIFSSTSAVYGTPQILPVPETAPTAPISPYGESKLMTERLLRDVAVAHPFRYVALRYFNVAGADPQLRAGQVVKNSTNLIKTVAELAAGKRAGMDVMGDDYDTPDGTGVRDFIHVVDLADAHVAALDYLIEGGDNQVLNCGYGRGYSVLEVIRAASDVVGRPLPYRIGPRRAGDPAEVVADARRIGALLRWNPRFTALKRIMETSIAWERALA
ncbi:MAG: UDP-glucose 4-epimerase GalE [Rhodospirillaceae bacterium]|nr:UDP-glucose 4-epimerase GalE [Rhodospirillaceae bacterium]